jgi:hypothetical protein
MGMLVLRGAGGAGGAEIKKPLSLAALRGVARDGSLPVGLWSHALGKDDGCIYSSAAGNDLGHAFSFPS